MAPIRNTPAEVAARKAEARQLSADGIGTAEIARRMGLAKRTIRSYLTDSPASAPDEAPVRSQRAVDRTVPPHFAERNRRQSEGARLLRSEGRDPLEGVLPGESVVLPHPVTGEPRVLVKTKARDQGAGYMDGLPLRSRFTLP